MASIVLLLSALVGIVPAVTGLRGYSPKYILKTNGHLNPVIFVLMYIKELIVFNKEVYYLVHMDPYMNIVVMGTVTLV